MGQVYVLISRVTDPQARGFVFFAPLGVWSFSLAKKLRWPELPAHRPSAQGFVGGHLPALASGGYQRGRRLEEGLQRDQRVGLRAGPWAAAVSHPAAGEPGTLHPAQEQVVLNAAPTRLHFLALPRSGDVFALHDAPTRSLAEILDPQPEASVVIKRLLDPR